MNKGNDNSSRARKTRSKLFLKFLKESGIKTLVFLGKCMQFYGIKTVFVFILGMLFASILYVYAGNYLNRVPIINKLIKVTNHAPVLSGVPTTTEYRFVGGEKLIFFAEAHDDDKNLKDTPYSLIDHDGSGMIIDSKSGKVEWSMDFSGTYKITVIAKDKFDAIDYQTFTVTDQKEITIRGCVKRKIKEGNDIKSFYEPFEIALAVDRQGPFNKSTIKDGSYKVKFPYLREYDVVVWSLFREDPKIYYGIEVKRDGDDYCFFPELEIPE